MNPNTSATSIGVRTRRLIASTGLALALSISVGTAGIAAPGLEPGQSVHRSQNVDYIGADQGQWLDLGFTVLVPSWVPSPFGGSPSIDAGGGYYSLYWMNGGGDPTFLQVTGTVGGGLPAGSPYDLNNELFINASVMGYQAIHDVTPAYDAVWWIAGGVLYKVESRNSSVDSLSLANSLIAFVPPSAPEPTPIPVEPTPIPVEPTPVDPGASGGSSGGEGSGSSSSGGSTDSGQETEGQTDTGETEPDTTTDESGGDTAGATATEVPGDQVSSDGTGQPFANSDGTGGPRPGVIGGDGTGGTIDVVIRPKTSTGNETP